MSEASLSFRSACLAGDALAAQSALEQGGLLFRRLPALSGIPVWSPELRRLDTACHGQTTLALKPSGAGGGDCAVAVVRAPGVPFWQKNPVIKSFASVELNVTGAGACAEVEKPA